MKMDGSTETLSTAAPATGHSAAAPIYARNVTVAYDGRPVLRSVSFQLEPGTLTGVVGPNGAGKSTLLKAILGLVPLDAGRIEIFGQPIEQCRQRLAYVPQKQTIDWDFPVTVADVVLMGRYGRMSLLARPGAADRRSAETALRKVGMSEFAQRHIRQLSGGQQQRVFLARALCQEADVLLLDEPLAGVDAATETAIFKLMDDLADAGKAMLLVNHDLAVLDHFDAVMLLNQHVIAFGPTGITATTENLRRTYGGRLSLLDQADAALQEMR